ncbi:hypothetical protein [Rhodopila sp.]|uniref:hypothetical protein n=1 Tax=Rhodopila sp. TaxID=2480087 RepID=UPI002B85B696|nr:hypothetical protein [Rhodopila sp.]HVZ09331.1 hypothetical protein [Rhodopila sp.]
MTVLADSEKVDVRRYCGFPAYGAAAEGLQSWRFFQIYGLLEFRINNLSDAELVVVRAYLTTLSGLEAGVTGAADNLDTTEAGVWTRNASEVKDRLALFDEWRRRLCGFIGVPAGPFLGNQAGTLVV